MSATPRSASIMNRIVTSSLRQPFIVGLMTVLLMGAGARSLDRLPVDAYPDLSPPIVEVITQWPGHAAEEVERLITVPVELAMNGTPQMSTSRSISLYGLSDVILTFHIGTDNYFARQQAFNRLPEANLPGGVTPTLSPMSAPSGLIYRYVLQSSDRPPMELKTFEDWIVEPQYKSVDGVADDSGFGGGTMQYQVLLDPGQDCRRSACRCCRWRPRWPPTTATPAVVFIHREASSIYVRGLGRLETAGGHRQCRAGRDIMAHPMLLKDVGRVVIGIAPRLGEFGYEKQDDCGGRRHLAAHRR